MEIPMTRNDMADLLSTRPETIARTITAFKREGWVKFSGRFATLNNIAALRKEAG